MDQALKILHVDHLDGNRIFVELSNGTTLLVTLEELLAGNHTTRPTEPPA